MKELILMAAVIMLFWKDPAVIKNFAYRNDYMKD